MRLRFSAPVAVAILGISGAAIAQVVAPDRPQGNVPDPVLRNGWASNGAAQVPAPDSPTLANRATPDAAPPANEQQMTPGLDTPQPPRTDAPTGARPR